MYLHLLPSKLMLNMILLCMIQCSGSHCYPTWVMHRLTWLAVEASKRTVQSYASVFYNAKSKKEMKHWLVMECNEEIKFGLHQSFVVFLKKINVEVCFHRLRWKISRVIISGLVLRIFGCRKFLLYIFCYAIQFSAQPLTSNNAGKSLDVNIRLKDSCSLCPTCYLLIPNSVYFLYTL